MNCKQCGKKMTDGARFCISCGAEHSADGQLILKKAPVDYNKTVMSNDRNLQSNNKQKVDYNKTMMANDIPQKNVDYNITMMASDIPQVNNSKLFSKPVNGKSSSSANTTKIKKKFRPIILICIVIVLILPLFVIAKNNYKNKNGNNIKQNETQIETMSNGNVVSDFDASAGYWSQDAEFFYKNGSKLINKWIGDYYVGSDGRKARNQLIDDTYYVDADGKKVKNEWYKFNKKIAGNNVTIWYYLGNDGAKLKDTYTPDGYYVDKDGIYIPGEVYDGPDSQHYVP